MKTKQHLKRLSLYCIAAIMTVIFCVSICICFNGNLPGAVADTDRSKQAFSGYSAGLSDNELYDATNTYRYTGNPYNKNDKNEEINYRTYNEYYNLDNKTDSNKVSDSAPQITVVTHGLGGNASHWSNNCLNVEWVNGTTFTFAYSEDSVMTRIERELLGEGGANLYWAKMNDHDSFNLFDLKDVDNINSDGTYSASVTTNEITDISKHIIIIFEAFAYVEKESANEYNNYVYEEFNYMLSKIVYDVKALNGGKLPKINLIGHSRGGITNLQYALDHPDMVAGLFSLGTPYFGTDTGSTDLGASVAGGGSNGLDDIIDRNVYVGYFNRWHAGYDTYYKNINTYALGGYSDTDFLFDILIKDEKQFGVVKKNGVSSTALKAFKGIVKSLPKFVYNLTELSRKIDYCISLFRDVDYTESEFESYMQILSDVSFCDRNSGIGDNILHMLPFVGCPYFMNDLLVDLPSQTGVDKHSDHYRSYGFKVYTKKFTDDDFSANGKIRLSAAMPAVVHNLEAQDKDLLSKIIENIDVGYSADKFLYNLQDDGSASIYGIRGDVLENDVLVMPPAIDGYVVSNIEDGAFEYSIANRSATKIFIPKSIKKIGKYAFRGCTSITEIEFESDSTITVLDEGCFADCAELSKINLPASLKTIGAGAFYGCSALTSIEVGANVGEIGLGAFSDCENLLNISVDASNGSFKSDDGILLTIDGKTLRFYPEAKAARTGAYVVPETVTEIDSFAFYANDRIQSIDLKNVTTVRTFAFAYCGSLKNITADNVIDIADGSFDGTAWFDSDREISALSKVLVKYNGRALDLILDDYDHIAPYAFAGNEYLRSVTLPNNIVNIGAGTFLACDNLKEVFITKDSDIVYAGKNVFSSDGLQIYVPAPLKAQYLANDFWRQYADNISAHQTVIKFVSNGGSLCEDKIVEYSAPIGQLCVPVREGYSFDGWYYYDDLSGTKIDQADIWKEFSDEVTVFAKWQLEEYQITYISGSTTIPDLEPNKYDITQKVDLPTPQDSPAYRFGGWYCDSDCTQSAGNGFPAGTTGDKVFYAKWLANSFNVVLNLHDDPQFPAQSLSKDNSTVEYGADDFSFEVPIRVGFTFNGWKVNGSFVSSNDGTANRAWNFAEDVTAYADWTRNSYYIKIDTDGKIVWLTDDGFTETQESIEYGAVFDTVEDMEQAFNPNKKSLKAGHKFDYFTLKNGTKFKLWEQVAAKFKAGDIIEIKAHFTKEINFKIEFLDEKTDGINNLVNAAFGDSISLMIPKSLPIGTTFNYWKVAEHVQNERFRNTELSPGTIFNFTKMPDLSIGEEEDGVSIYLKADYTYNLYTIWFSSMYGTPPSSTTITCNSKKYLGKPSAVFGRSFNGWYTGTNGSGTQITDAAGNMLSVWNYDRNVTLYAYWTNIEYTIRLISNGKVISTQKYDIDSLPVRLSEPTLSGYRFMGWYSNSEFTESRVYYVNRENIGNKTYYAYWEKLYTVSFNSNGGSTVSSVQGIQGEIITLPSSTRDKYCGTWNYWGYLTGDSSISNFGYDYTISSSDVTLTAVWKSLEYTIYFNQNGGSGGTSSVKVTVGEAIPVITNPTRVGYSFSGYKDSKGEWFSLSSSTSAVIYDKFSNTTLTAQWKPRTWSIVFWVYTDTIDNGYGDMIEMTYDQVHPKYGKTLTAPDLDGWDFKEWRKFSQYFQLNYDGVYYSGEKTVTIHNILPPNNFQYFLAACYEKSCVAEGTLITLADRSQKAVEDLTGNEMLLVWNLYTGTFDVAPILFIDSDPMAVYEVINLYFSDGTVVKVISEHGFWNVNLNKYVYLNSNASQYIGQWFNKHITDDCGSLKQTQVMLTDVKIIQERTTAWSPVTYGHLCYYVNGMLSMPGGINGMFNIFDVDAETMAFDREAMAADISRYGLFTYEEFNALVPVPEEMFYAVNGEYLKVAIGKGIVSVEQLKMLVDRYSIFI